MTSQVYQSPNGDLIVGTAETLSATALISGINPETGEPTYEGGTEIDWDAQQTTTLNGKTIFVCEVGKRWTFDQLQRADLASEPRL